MTAVKPTFLIIGGGFAGITLAKAIHNDANVTLVDSKEYFEVNFATPRAIVEPALVDQLVVQYKDMHNIGTFIRGTVVELDIQHAKLSDGQVIKFDYAAICTGSSYSNSINKGTVQGSEDRVKQLKEASDKIKAAKKILVVGGGPTGVELAGELVTDFEAKEVIVVQSGPRLLPSIKEKLGKFAQKFLESKGAKVLLNEKLQRTDEEGNKFKTSSGVDIDADLVFWCTGISVSTGFLRPALEESLDEQGRVKVDPNLRMVGTDNLFACGDVTDVPETKLAFLAGKHAELVAKNFRALAKSGAKAKLGAWKPNMGMQVEMVSLGRGSGVMQLGCLACTGGIPKSIKSVNVAKFVDMWRKVALA